VSKDEEVEDDPRSKEGNAEEHGIDLKKSTGDRQGSREKDQG